MRPMEPVTLAGLVFLLFKGGILQADVSYKQALTNMMQPFIDAVDLNNPFYIYLKSVETAINADSSIESKLTDMHNKIGIALKAIKDHTQWTICGETTPEQIVDIHHKL